MGHGISCWCHQHSFCYEGRYTSHGLHLDSQGKRRLVNCIAEKMGDNHVKGVSSIPVITSARASPFLV
jgi:hypothetical protein